MDLFEEESEVERSAEEDRKNSLARALAASANSRKKKKLIDPLDYIVSIEANDLADYQPIFGWELDRPTEKQVKAIENFGIDPVSISTKGQAAKLLDSLIGRVDMASPKQINVLQRYGFKEVYRWKKDEASAIIAELAAVNWQIWKCHLIPEYYQPKRLRSEAS